MSRGHPSPAELMRMVDSGSMHKGSPEEYIDLKSWSVSGELEVTVAGAARVRRVVQLQAKLPPSYHTIQFNRTPNSRSSGRPLNTRAEIFWQTANSFIRRVFDVGDGSAISGACDTVTLRITDNDTPQPLGAGFTYLVSAQIMSGTRQTQPGCVGPTLDLGTTGVLAPVVGTFTYTLPEDTGATSFIPTIRPISPTVVTYGSGEIQIIQLADGGTPLVINNYEASGLWLPLNARTRLIRITNLLAVGTIEGFVTLGIEG